MDSPEKYAASESRIAVLGLGYVGCVTAACLARLGHRVTGVERDAHKVSSVVEGRAPFFEPGLDDLIRDNVAAGRLSASTCVEEGLENADIALICVGTPSDRNGNLGLDQLRRVCAEMAKHVASRSKPLIVGVRSTVFPGTCEEVVTGALGDPTMASVVCNPEFLRQGSAVRDFMEPSLVVVGGSDAASRAQVAGLYCSLGVEPCLVSLRVAEMIKYACNAFHAVKIGFANEIGALCSELGVQGEEVMETLCRDVRLNLSAAYLRPGFAFGGSCLPKDLRALVYRANCMQVTLPLIESVLPGNAMQLKRGIAAVLALPCRRIGVFGLAYKENTDDLRESPAVALLEGLLDEGREVRVFDPHIRLEQIYGSNRDFILSVIPRIEERLESSFEGLLQWAEHVVITQKIAPPFAELIRRSGTPVLDLTSG
jgi:GDP-mannose 6-dehydrogenase